MYKRGAIVIQKPPSVLHHLLGGLGMGITQGVEKQMKKAEERRAKASNVLESVLSGDLDPTLLATEEGQGWLRKKGIYEDPDIQNTIFQGQVKAGLLGESGMGPPAPYTLTEAHKSIEDTAARLARRSEVQKIEDSLFVFEQKEHIKKEVNRPRPLNERLDKAVKAYNRLLKMGIPVEDVQVTDPDSGIKIDLLTHIENLTTKQVENIAKGKSGIKYLNELSKFYDLQINTAKYFHNLVLGKTEPESDLTGEFRTLLDEMMESLGRKKLSTQDIRTQVRRLIPLFNQKIKIQHQILVKQKKITGDPAIKLPFLKQFNMKEAMDETGKYSTEFEFIGKYKNSIDNVTQSVLDQEKREAIEGTNLQPVKESQARGLVISPPDQPQPTAEEIEVKAKEILAAAAGLVGPGGETMTIELARRLAREALGVKKRPGAKK